MNEKTNSRLQLTRSHTSMNLTSTDELMNQSSQMLTAPQDPNVLRLPLFSGQEDRQFRKELANTAKHNAVRIQRIRVETAARNANLAANMVYQKCKDMITIEHRQAMKALEIETDDQLMQALVRMLELKNEKQQQIAQIAGDADLIAQAEAVLEQMVLQASQDLIDRNRKPR